MWSFNLICVIFIILSIFSIDGKDVNSMKKKKKNVSIQTLVHGGTFNNITNAPYMALLYHRTRDYKPKEFFACGACIIHERFLLTAAHCYAPDRTHFVKVGTDVVDGGIKHEIGKMIIHPRYNIGAEANNDIAVIKLRSKLNFNKRVNKIEMAPKNYVIKPGVLMFTMGFGATEVSDSSRHLLIVQVPYVPRYKCQFKLKTINATKPYTITNSMICAGGVKGKDSCNGDSGGPLVYDNKLVGLVSFGYKCGKEMPGVYASIPALRGFVDSMIGNL